MKNTTRTLPAVLLLVILSLAACKDSLVERRTYSANVPDYMSYSDLRMPVKSTAPTELSNNGKIYVKDHYLFINEKYKGIHVYDNSNPAAPANLIFIDIPGNVDLSVKGDFLYADSYTDLVVLNISDISQPVEVARLKDVFPYTIPEVDNSLPLTGIDPQKGVITGWKVIKVTEDVGSQGGYPYYYFDKITNVYSVSTMNTGGIIPASQTVGVGGSLARFIIYGNQFYGLNQNSLQVISLIEPDAPALGAKIDLQHTAETVFIDSTRLFIGTQTGMLIYDLSQPFSPQYITQFNHFQSCDPVVVQDNIAYVTMRSGNNCGNFQNAMDVVDLHVITNPQLIKTYPLTQPYGIGIDHKTLFVCDGSAGLKIYNATDPLRIDENLIKTFADLQAFDVIPLNGILILIAADGLYQYDYTDLNKLHLLSKIAIGK